MKWMSKGARLVLVVMVLLILGGCSNSLSDQAAQLLEEVKSSTELRNDVETYILSQTTIPSEVLIQEAFYQPNVNFGGYLENAIIIPVVTKSEPEIAFQVTVPVESSGWLFFESRTVGKDYSFHLPEPGGNLSRYFTDELLEAKFIQMYSEPVTALLDEIDGLVMQDMEILIYLQSQNTPAYEEILKQYREGSFLTNLDQQYWNNIFANDVNNELYGNPEVSSISYSSIVVESDKSTIAEQKGNIVEAIERHKDVFPENMKFLIIISSTEKFEEDRVSFYVSNGEIQYIVD